MGFDPIPGPPEFGALRFRLRRANAFEPLITEAAVQPPVWMLHAGGCLMILDSAPSLRVVDAGSQLTLWSMEVSGEPMDLQTTVSGDVALLEFTDESSRVTIFEQRTGRIVIQMSLVGVKAGWLACLAADQLAVTDTLSGDLLVLNADGEVSRRMSIGPGVRGVWSGDDVCVVLWPAGNRICIFELREWSVRTVEAHGLETVIGAALAPGGDWLLMTRYHPNPPLCLHVDEGFVRPVSVTGTYSAAFGPILAAPDGKTVVASPSETGALLLHLKADRLRFLRKVWPADGFAFGARGDAYIFTADGLTHVSLQ